MEPTELSSQSAAGLVRTASEQIAGLVRAEIQLARSEVAAKGKRAAVGAGMLAGAGVLALYGLAVLLAAFVLLLALVLPAWAAALIVAGVLFVGAVVLVLAGRASLKRGLPPVPNEAVASVRSDIDTVKAALHDRGHGNPRPYQARTAADGAPYRANGEVSEEARRQMTGPPR